MTKKSMQSEQNFKRAFTPLTSKKDGKAQLTFAGYKHSVTNDGKGAFLKIVFSVLDITGKDPQNISILSSYKYSETNVLGKLLKVMGYQHESKEIVIDEDDEFGHVLEENLNIIYDYLDLQKGLVSKGFCTQKPNSKNELWYQIDVESIEPCLDKQGKQKRAYDALEGLSEKDLNVDIEAQGGDEDQ